VVLKKRRKKEEGSTSSPLTEEGRRRGPFLTETETPSRRERRGKGRIVWFELGERGGGKG